MKTLKNLETEMEGFVQENPEFEFLECLLYDFADALHVLSITRLVGEQADLNGSECNVRYLLSKILAFEESYHGERDPNRLWVFLGDIMAGP